MKNVIKSYFSAVTINNILLAIFLYLVIFTSSSDDWLFNDIGLGDMIAVLLVFTFVQLLFLPLIAWPFFVLITKYRPFSAIHGIFLGILIMFIYNLILVIIKQSFDIYELIGFLVFGLWCGCVFAIFYYLFNRRAKHIQR